MHAFCLISGLSRVELGRGSPWKSNFSPGPFFSPGLLSIGFFHTGLWTGQHLFSWSPSSDPVSPSLPPLKILNCSISWSLQPWLNLTFTSLTSPFLFISIRSSRASLQFGSLLTSAMQHHSTLESFWITHTLLWCPISRYQHDTSTPWGQRPENMRLPIFQRRLQLLLLDGGSHWLAQGCYTVKKTSNIIMENRKGQKLSWLLVIGRSDEPLMVLCPLPTGQMAFPFHFAYPLA